MSESVVLPAVRIALAAAASAAILLSARILASGAIDWNFGLFTLRIHDLGRPVAAGATAALILIAIGWRSRFWRTIGGEAFVACGACALLARHIGTTWPVGDNALIELYTLQAVNGRQLLGAYSQYGWRHPGPLPFYWLAPFYALGGFTTYGLSVGMLVANLAAIGIVVWILVGPAKAGHYVRGLDDPGPADARFSFSLVFLAFLAIYLTRVPGLLTNAWNPHTPMLPFMALTFVTASMLNGNVRLLPLAAALATFVVQAHVGFTIVAAALAVLCVLAVIAAAWQRIDLRPSIAARLVATTFLLIVLWLLPVSEQIVHVPGNMTRIWQFFASDYALQPLGLAWRAWSSTLAGMLRPAFALSVGNPIPNDAPLWAAAIGSVFVIGLGPAAVMARRAGRSFVSWLAIVSMVASIAGFWAVVHIRFLIGDYHIFWLSLIGLVNMAVVLSEAVASLNVGLSDRGSSVAVRLLSAAAFVWIASLGIRPLLNATDHLENPIESPTAKRLFEQVSDMLRSIGHRPIIRLDEGLWSIGAGVILQMTLHGQPVAVAPEMVWLFGEGLEGQGDEDVLLTISRTGRHLEIAARPHHVTIASSGTYYVDAVSLIDAPEFRPR